MNLSCSASHQSDFFRYRYRLTWDSMSSLLVEFSVSFVRICARWLSIALLRTPTYSATFYQSLLNFITASVKSYFCSGFSLYCSTFDFLINLNVSRSYWVGSYFSIIYLTRWLLKLLISRVDFPSNLEILMRSPRVSCKSLINWSVSL